MNELLVVSSIGKNRLFQTGRHLMKVILTTGDSKKYFKMIRKKAEIKHEIKKDYCCTLGIYQL